MLTSCHTCRHIHDIYIHISTASTCKQSLQYGDVEVQVDAEGGGNHFNVQHVVGVDNPAGV